MKTLRIIIDCSLFLAIFMLPWWLTLIMAIIATIFFNQYIEIIIIGFLIDSLYSAPIERWFHFQFVLTLLGVILLLGIEWGKTKLRFSHH